MGRQEPDECIFCESDLEEYSYGYFEENGERAIEGMGICKECANKLKEFVNK